MTAPAVRTLQEMDALRAALDSTGGYRDYLASFIGSRLDITDEAEQYRQANDFTVRVGQCLTAGEAFHVQPDMLPLVTWAADTLPDDTKFEQHTLPAPAGFMWLADPIMCRSIRRDTIVMRALTWGAGTNGVGGAPGITVVWWSDPTDPRDDEAAREGFAAWREQVRPPTRLVPAHITTMPYGDMAGPADHIAGLRAQLRAVEDTGADLQATRDQLQAVLDRLRDDPAGAAAEGADVDALTAQVTAEVADVDRTLLTTAGEAAAAREAYARLFAEADREQYLAELDDPDTDLSVTNMDRWALALWTLMGQTVTTLQRAELTGGAGRAWLRKRLRPAVTVIHLRASARGPREPGESDRHYSVRWVRRGHWRRQRHGQGLTETRMLWIAPTVCGPDGAPLVVTRHVYDLAR